MRNHSIPGGRNDRLWLLILLLAGTSVAFAVQPPADRDELLAAMNAALAAHDWHKAAAAGERLAAAEPKAASVHYNLACVHVKLGRMDDAMAALRRSAENGFSLLSTFGADEDLDPLRGRKGFAEIQAIVQRNHEAEFERFKLRADREARVLTFLPPGGEPKRSAHPAPLIVALHGSGGVADHMADVWRPIAARCGAILICPQGMLPMGGGMSWGKVQDGEYLVERAIEQTRRKHRVDERRMVLTGFSQGASVSFTLAARRPDLFCGVIPVVGHYEPRYAPIRPMAELPAAAQSPGPTSLDQAQPSARPHAPSPPPRWVLFCGESDPEADNNRSAAELLGRCGYPVELHIYHGGHQFPPQRDAALQRAVEAVLAAR